MTQSDLSPVYLLGIIAKVGNLEQICLERRLCRMFEPDFDD